MLAIDGSGGVGWVKAFAPPLGGVPSPDAVGATGAVQSGDKAGSDGLSERRSGATSPLRGLEAERLDPAKENSAEARALGELSDGEQRMVEQLRARDREVRDHEQAHARVGGPYAGEPSYSYQTGPDGKRYAIGGEVPIDVSPVPDNPEATISKMEVVKAAALAPAEPSGQDRRVAALADAQRLAAVADLAELRQAERADQAEQGYRESQTILNQEAA